MRSSRTLGFVLLLGLLSEYGLGLHCPEAWAQGSADALAVDADDGTELRAGGTAPAAPESGAASEAVLEARRSWYAGLAAAEAGKYELAVEAFRQSYAAVPHVETLRNLALAELEVGDFVHAATHLSEYLAESTELAPRERASLERELASTERMVAKLNLEVTPEQAVVRVDGVRVELPRSGQPLYLKPGRHTVDASYKAATPIERAIDIGPGRYVVLRLQLEGASGSAVSRSASGLQGRERGEEWMRPADASHSGGGVWPEPKRWVVVCGGVLTAVSLGVAAYGESTLSAARSDVRQAGADLSVLTSDKDACVAPTGTIARRCNDLRAAQDAEQRSAQLSNVGFIMAGVFGAATAAAWFLWPNGDPEQDAASALVSRSSPRLRTAPWATPRSAGWAVSGRF